MFCFAADQPQDYEYEDWLEFVGRFEDFDGMEHFGDEESTMTDYDYQDDFDFSLVEVSLLSSRKSRHIPSIVNTRLILHSK